MFLAAFLLAQAPVVVVLSFAPSNLQGAEISVLFLRGRRGQMIRLKPVNGLSAIPGEI